MLRIEELESSVGRFQLKDVALSIPAGKYGVLLGPTGSGKTVLMETICGLRSLTSGRILIGDVDVTQLAPRERGIGYVPQDYVLFPTKTIAANLALGLRAQGLRSREIGERIGPLVKMLGIEHLLDRWPATLSGGEQQRVALARALAIRPRLLLLDEPVSALDEATCESVCMELKRVQRETGTTTLHVCHNLEEARAVADNLCIMRQGQVVQSGVPDEAFRYPFDKELALFLRVGSVLVGTAEQAAGGSILHIGSFRLRLAAVVDGPVQVLVRAHEITVTREPPQGSPGNVIACTVQSTWSRGLHLRVDVVADPEIRLTALVPLAATPHTPGESVWLSFPPSAVHVLED